MAGKSNKTVDTEFQAELSLVDKLKKFYRKIQKRGGFKGDPRNLSLNDFLKHYLRYSKLIKTARPSSDQANRAVYSFKTIKEAETIALLLANHCPNPETAGVGLVELLLNAVEHGNLAIGYQGKSKHLEEGDFNKEIERRYGLPDYMSRKAHIEYRRENNRIVFIIRDEGEGFNWRQYMDFSPSRLTHKHGRGIAIASSLGFSSVDYQGSGNKVVATIELDEKASPSKNFQQPSIANSKVMIVDSNDLDCEKIRCSLGIIGVLDVQIMHDGTSCLDAVKIQNPDLIVVSSTLSDMSGIELLKMLYSQPINEHLSITIKSANSSSENMNELLSSGAKYVIQISDNQDLLGSQLRMQLENILLMRGLNDFHQRLEIELNAARDMQKRLMPRESDIADALSRFNIKIDAHCQPSTELGGDLWGIQYLDTSLIGIYVVDFSGHGVGASINTFRLHTIMQQFPAPASPARYLQFLNNQIFDIVQRDQFATMMFAIIDIEKDILTYSVAGAPPPLVYYPQSDNLSVGPGTGLPIGIIRDVEYKNTEMKFPSSASLFMYSDALYEMPQNDGEIIGLHGVEAFARQTMKGNDPQLNLDRVLQKFFENRGDSVNDDLTLVLASRIKNK